MEQVQFLSNSNEKSQKARYHRMKLSKMFIMDKFKISIPDFDSVKRNSYDISFKSNVNYTNNLSF